MILYREGDPKGTLNAPLHKNITLLPTQQTTLKVSPQPKETTSLGQDGIRSGHTLKDNHATY